MLMIARSPDTNGPSRIPEAQVLSSMTIETNDDMITAAKNIGDKYHCAVLLKGGHSVSDANDLL